MTSPPPQPNWNEAETHRKTVGQKVCIGLAAIALTVGAVALMLSSCPFRARIPAVPPMPPAPAAIRGPAVVNILLRTAPQVSVAARASGTWRGREPDGATLASGKGPWRIGAADGALTLDGQPLQAATAELHTRNDLFQLDSRTYKGSLLIRATDDGVKAFNLVEPEQYLKSVVGSEMYSSWPLNALMAQAVAARTYMLYTHRAKGYLTLLDMAYKGVSAESRAARLAVELTEGLVLTYDDDLFSAYFHSTCGGHTVAAGKVFEDKTIAPLSGVPCEWCRRSPAYRWRVEIAADRIAESVKAAGSAAVRSIVPLDAGPDGYARSVLINGEAQMDAYDFRLAVGGAELKSTRFTVTELAGKFLFEGGGYGHGVGLCQWGACGLAKEGHDWQGILGYYYPGAAIQHID